MADYKRRVRKFPEHAKYHWTQQEGIRNAVAEATRTERIVLRFAEETNSLFDKRCDK